MPLPRARCKLLASLSLLVLIVTGCPRRYDLRAEPLNLKASPDAAADRLYRDAKARLDAGEASEAADRFAEFGSRYPQDPLAKLAQVGEARARLALGERDKARALVEPLARPDSPLDVTGDAVEARARFVLGIVLFRGGNLARAETILREFDGQLTPGDDAIDLHAALASCAAERGELESAARHYAIYAKSARGAEIVFVRDRVAALAQRAGKDQAARIWQIAGIDVPELRKAPSAAVGRAIGCVLPLSGRGRTLGERALRGVLLGAGALSSGGGDRVDVRVRDTESSAERGVSAVDELVKEGVAAIVTSPDRAEAQSTIARAEALGVPVLSLAPDDNKGGRVTFRIVSARARAAEALAEAAVTDGVKTFAVLAPDSAYGRVQVAAFMERARARNLRVAVELRFAESTTTFLDLVRRVKTAQVDAIFIPAATRELSLLLSQLAAGGVVRIAGVNAVGKVATVYTTAEGLNEKFMLSSGKYLQGAVVAPAFYGASPSPDVQRFVDKYHAQYSEDPGALDALAYDAARAVSAAIALGAASSWQSMADALRRVRDSGATGEIGFGPGGERTAKPSLYRVDAGALIAR